MPTPVQDHLLSLGDWRHPGVYAVVHAPTGLEYVGASICVKRRIGPYLQAKPREFWQGRLWKLTGKPPSTEELCVIWLETCLPVADCIREAEERHHRLRKPVLSGDRYRPYGIADGTVSPVPSGELGAPPPPMDVGHIKAAEITLQLQGISAADRRAETSLHGTRRQLGLAMAEIALRYAEAEYSHRLSVLCSDCDPAWDVWPPMGSALPVAPRRSA
jgi:hypothetical protein